MSSSAPKNLKLDDVETNQNPPDCGDDSSDDGGYEHMTRNEIEEYRCYIKEVQESDGFNVNFVPRAFRKRLGGYVLACDLSDPEVRRVAKKCTRYAIKQYNELMKGKSRLKYVKITNANRSQSTISIFYITFKAKDTASKLSDVYQTRVTYHSPKGDMFLHFIRKEGQKEEIRFPVDFDDDVECAKMIKCTQLAISIYNEIEKDDLKYVKLVEALMDANKDVHSYTIIFEAKDTKSDQVNTYSGEITYDPKYEDHVLYFGIKRR